jgi:hypothetical protein
MGVSPFSSSGCADRVPVPPEPLPHRFRIDTLMATEDEGWCVVMANYPDCTTYSGYKVMVYDKHYSVIQNATLLDPHFLEKGLSPIARFVGNGNGLMNARAFVSMMREPNETKWKRIV